MRSVGGASRTGSVLTGGGHSAGRRRRGLHFGGGRGHGVAWGRLAAVAVACAIVAGALALRAQRQARADRHAAAVRFVTAWEHRDRAAMWRALTPRARARYPQAAFAAAYREADRTAGVRSVRAGAVGSEHGGSAAVRVALDLRDFGTLRGTIALALSGSGDEAGVDWRPALRLPGLREGESVRRSAGRAPLRGEVLAADGSRLDATALGASVAGTAGPPPTGLERVYDERLAGHTSAQLRFGRRVVMRTPAVAGRSVHTTVRPGLMRAASAALGGKLGGVAVVRPRDGAVRALAGLAVSAPQPPGSTFKIVTVSAALEHRLATPSTRYPLATSATLSGVKLGNANGERCGGTLTQAFVESCNSVFAPLGAKVGAERLVQTARAFGFGEDAVVPAGKPSTISPASGLRDDLAVGAAAIGQDRDLATRFRWPRSERRSPSAGAARGRGSSRPSRSSGVASSPRGPLARCAR